MVVVGAAVVVCGVDVAVCVAADGAWATGSERPAGATATFGRTSSPVSAGGSARNVGPVLAAATLAPVSAPNRASAPAARVGDMTRCSRGARCEARAGPAAGTPGGGVTGPVGRAGGGAAWGAPVTGACRAGSPPVTGACRAGVSRRPPVSPVAAPSSSARAWAAARAMAARSRGVVAGSCRCFPRVARGPVAGASRAAGHEPVRGGAPSGREPPDPAPPERDDPERCRAMGSVLVRGAGTRSLGSEPVSGGEPGVSTCPALGVRGPDSPGQVGASSPGSGRLDVPPRTTVGNPVE